MSQVTGTNRKLISSTWALEDEQYSVFLSLCVERLHESLVAQNAWLEIVLQMNVGQLSKILTNN